MLMQMEDFQNKMKDIQFMKVTREIQQVCKAEKQAKEKSDSDGYQKFYIPDKLIFTCRTLVFWKKVYSEILQF